MNNVYLLLGSNLGNRQANLDRARHEISRQAGPIITASSVYETEPWGNENQGMFYNQVIALQTTLDPFTLLSTLLAIEASLGRIRKEMFGPRLIDIDLLFYDDMIIHTDDLTVPHPALHARRFTLVPLTEIDPEFMHPVFRKSVSTLLEECPDQHRVNRVA